MRIWSLHPQYLDRQGLAAGWREGLLAQKVLTGTTKGYRNHPQLRRFRAAGDGAAMGIDAGTPGDDGSLGTGSGAHVAPAPGLQPGHHAPGTTVDVVPDVGAGAAISTYLHALVDEAMRRGYRFDRALVLGRRVHELRLEVTDTQVAYEWEHLRAKLAVRSPDVFARWRDVVVAEPHPMFRVVPGPLAEWEIVTVSDEPGADPAPPAT
ncbi:pyrimidine dimer DNA glycosylase/endonuclease V [Cellulomonas aerilata]|uniref:Pyrimidine dimer DNA glycosylase /DNA-(Apurinic or apyrimidinic site) lyase n=1 Tax=Cellulomonas aerilata TaxID=515326 RepID=A0A512D7U9_9CELL|nr:pyrimidine dimer DNA glycosylase /DNA-(apurinic or apyrimidinic site) lyase [Cellulomonas aerilata]